MGSYGPLRVIQSGRATHPARPRGWIAAAVLILSAIVAFQTASASDPAYSRFFLGAYRKTMDVEQTIAAACTRYGVPVELARAVCIHESGGNESLRSSAGAAGYFQVMPSTMRLMGVPTNIEAGVKYLGQMIDQFGREDLALAAYNAGPGRVEQSRPMPVETLQYVIAVSYFRTLLLHGEPAIRAEAVKLALHTVGEGESWAGIAQETGTTLTELRLYNVYQAARPLRPGQVIAYPGNREGVGTPIVEWSGEQSAWIYRTLPGDLYLHLAIAFDIPLDDIRADNALWRIQTPVEGIPLLIRPPVAGDSIPHVTVQGETVSMIAALHDTDPWAVVRDNGLWDERPAPGQILEIRKGERAVPDSPRADAPAEEPPSNIVHRVRSGENLTRIADTYGTTVGELRRLNGLRGSRLLVGQLLQVPASSQTPDR